MLNRLEGTVMTAAIGRTHSLGIFGNSGALRAWGSNGYGQLGSANKAVERLVPSAVAGLQDDMVVLVAAGWYHSFAITVVS